jgi:RHS repeat-associated protein
MRKRVRAGALLRLLQGVPLAAAACLGTVSPAHAQFEFRPPTIQVGDGTTAFTGTTAAKAVTVEIVGCSTTPGLTGFNVRLNGADVTARFQGALTGTSDPDCAQRYDASATLTFTPGEHRVVASINNITNDPATDSATYTYRMDARGVAVTPDRESAAGTAGQWSSHEFRVRNTGSVADTYTLGMSCADGLGGCSLSATSLTVAPGRDTTFTANFQVQYPGRESLLRVTARSGADATVQDGGSVTVTAGSPSGTAQAPVVSVLGLNPGGTPTPSLCVTMPAGAAADYQCGDLRLGHALPSVRTLGQVRTPMIVYHSQHAHPQPAVRVEVAVPAGAASPTRVDTRLFTQAGAEITAARRSFDGREWVPGQGARVVSLGWSDPALATGFHKYNLEVTSWYGTTPVSTTVPLTVAVVNRRNSLYGRGWWMAGLEQLDLGSMTWVGGDGAMRRYVSVGTGVWVAQSITHGDTLRAVDPASTYGPSLPADVRYMRVLPGGGGVFFDAAGRHVGTADAQYRWTRFYYNTQHGALDSIRSPTGLGPERGRRTHWLLYDNRSTAEGWRFVLTQVRSYNVAGQAERLTQLSHVTVNDVRVSAIRDPDGHSIGFGYDPAQAARIVSRTDRRGVPTAWRFNAAGKVVESRTDAGGTLAPVVMAWDPMESRGWTTSTRDAATQMDGPRTDVADLTRVEHNALGAPTRIVDAEGKETRITYAPHFPALAVHTRSPGGVVSTAAYDGLGRLLSVTDSSSSRIKKGVLRYATTHYAYGDTRHPLRPTRVISAEDDTAYTAYRADGTVEWVQDARGDSTRVSYHYRWDTGLLESVLSRRDSLRNHAPERFEYDSLGNLRMHTSPGGRVTDYVTDRLGRVVQTVEAPVFSDVAPQRAHTETVYDVMDRVVRTSARGPAVRFATVGPTGGPAQHMAPEQWLRTQTYYNASGQPDSVARWAEPDSLSRLKRLVTRWEYDRLGRTVREVAGDRQAEQRAYDAAGQLVGVLTRRGYLNEVRYDLMGRVVQRITPTVDYPRVVREGDHDTDWVFPLFQQVGPGVFGSALNAGGGVRIAADTARFFYDSLGRMERAENADARIARTYTANGTLLTETQRIRTYAPGAAAWNRAYTLRYEHDLMGRRTAVHHPPNLAPVPSGAPAGQERATRYWYGPAGTLDSIRGVINGKHSFAYDANGAMVTRNAAFSIENFGYDADGRTTRRLHQYGSRTIHDDSITYNAAGKAHQVRSVVLVRGDSVDVLASQVRYNGLGAMIYSSQISQGGKERTIESYAVDAFGNQAWQEQASYNYLAGSVGGEPREISIYQEGTGRQVAQIYSTQVSKNALIYDASGNVVETGAGRGVRTPYEHAGQSGAMALSWQRTMSYFGADERLRVLDKRSCLIFGTSPGECDEARTPPYNDRSAFEEYRYDALGRRVLTRTRASYACNQRCFRSVIRTVWDGDQALYEISAPGADHTSALMESDTPSAPVVNGTTGQGFYAYGRVAYTHGPGIDAPLSLTRVGYSSAIPEAVEVIPFVNWNGKYDGGAAPCTWISYANGGSTQLREYVPAPGDPEMITRPPGSGGFDHCVEADWPAWAMYNTLERRDEKRRNWEGAVSWMGSLVQHGRDASGQYYRRNRYYDANTGHFTQEDPIGLAGGANLYGYANGDPIGYHDPYGLSADTLPVGPVEAEEEDDEFGLWYLGLAGDFTVGAGVGGAFGLFIDRGGIGGYARAATQLGWDISAGGEFGRATSLGAFRGGATAGCAGGGFLNVCSFFNDSGTGWSVGLAVGPSEFFANGHAEVSHTWTRYLLRFPQLDKLTRPTWMLREGGPREQ